LIKRALISVYDKTGLEKLAEYLNKNSVEIVSSGGTYKAIEKAGLPVKKVSDVTGSSEILGGRVKTLHPNIHAGILARDDQLDELASHNIEPFDLVVVNLYPFEKVVAEGADLNTALENIDIGGPAMLRAAAKNLPRVTVICDPNDYNMLINEMDKNSVDTSDKFRYQCALKTFSTTSGYDNAIAGFLTKQQNSENEADKFASTIALSLTKENTLRYGENPHQQAALYADKAYPGTSLTGAKVLSGKELSFNNLWDL